MNNGEQCVIAWVLAIGIGLMPRLLVGNLVLVKL